MPQFADPAFEDARGSFQAERARAEQVRSQARLHMQRLCDAHRALAEVVGTSRGVMAASRQLVGVDRSPQRLTEASPSKPARPASPCALDRALAAAGFIGADLNEAADDLIAAYRTAVELDDAEMQVSLRAALLLIGRHLATRVGPKAAGVRLN